MKKFMILLFVLCVLVITSMSSWAGSGECTYVNDTARSAGKLWVEVTATCQADSGAATFTTDQIDGDFSGMFLHSVNTTPGATGPTDNSDLTILENSSSGYDVLNGAGANTIDNATDNNFKPVVNSNDTDMPIYDDLYIAIANNSVNDAITIIILKFYQ